VQGTPLDRVRLDEADFEALGAFVGGNLRDIRPGGSAETAASVEARLDGLLSRRLISQAVRARLDPFLRAPFAPAGRMADCVGFCDASLKNFLRRPDGSLVYVDVFGIYRDAPGNIAVQLLCKVERPSRPALLLGFRRGLRSSDLDLHLPFCYLSHLAARVVAKSSKVGFFSRMRGNRKVRRALKEMNEMSRLHPCTAAAERWILTGETAAP
jgi:hypothetical protein